MNLTVSEPSESERPNSIDPEHLIEPGILQVLRWATLILWIIHTLTLCETVSKTPPDLFVIFNWLFFGLLLLILYRRRLQVRLGHRFLPIALILVSAGPILGDAAASWLYAANKVPIGETTLDPSRLHIWLILPLLLVSLQYGVKIVATFTAGTIIIPVLLAIPPARFYGGAVRQHLQQGVVRLVLYLLVGFIISRITTQQREQRQELAIKNGELTRLTTSLEDLTITRERNRLARELHDTLSHTLSAVNIQLKALETVMETDPAAAKNRVAQMQNLTRDGLNEARRALGELRAKPIEEFGLATALRRLAQQAAERGGFQIQIAMPLQFEGVPSQTEQQIYRIAEEAFNNIVRHAQARRVDLSFNRRGNRLTLEIKDDGVGFDLSNRPDSRYGVTGMQERARLIGGSLSFQSQSDAGTTIQLTVDL
ncbi:MAG: signal transduction histidine kinase [Cellvibrionaceae bacterium]|jgi:signal transduction histidine kinase